MRAPWGQPRGSERDALEQDAVHRLLCDANGKVVAVGRLHRSGDQDARFVAYIRLDAHELALLPGMTGRVEVVTGEQ